MSNNDSIKRTVGKKIAQPIAFDASTELLLKGVKFNEEMQKAFGIRHIGVQKGVYRFKSHDEANQHLEECIANNMARLAELRK